MSEEQILVGRVRAGIGRSTTPLIYEPANTGSLPMSLSSGGNNAGTPLLTAAVGSGGGTAITLRM